MIGHRRTRVKLETVTGRTSARKVKQMKRTLAWVHLLVLSPVQQHIACSVQMTLPGSLQACGGCSNPQRLADGTTAKVSNTSPMLFLTPMPSHVLRHHESESAQIEVGNHADAGRKPIRMTGSVLTAPPSRSTRKRGLYSDVMSFITTPTQFGRATKRWYTFQGTNRMSLRIDSQELNPPVVESTLIWSES